MTGFVIPFETHQTSSRVWVAWWDKSSIPPLSLRVSNQDLGVLVEGFDTPPYVMTGHAPAYYGAAIERCGYRPAQDLLAYGLDGGTLAIPRVMRALIERSGDRIKVRKLNLKAKPAELESMRDIFNDAWKNNWNFTPFTREEFRLIGRELGAVTTDSYGENAVKKKYNNSYQK